MRTAQILITVERLGNRWAATAIVSDFAIDGGGEHWREEQAGPPNGFVFYGLAVRAMKAAARRLSIKRAG